jgi:glycosyltransferase involved in cell wall biosynthesis
MTPSRPQFSVVIPARNEAANLAHIVNEVVAVMPDKDFEIIVVDDGSTDNTADTLRGLAKQHSFLRHVVHDQNCGKSAAILTGVRAASAPVIVTMDGDGQSDPRFIRPLLERLADPGVGLVAGQRTKHAHSKVKQIGSRLANALRASLLKDLTRDTACGLKAFSRETFLRLPYFDTMHRYLPALVLREGLAVRHVEVTDRPRRHGASNYGLWDRLWLGIFDLFGVWWLMRRRKRVAEISEV